MLKVSDVSILMAEDQVSLVTLHVTLFFLEKSLLLLVTEERLPRMTQYLKLLFVHLRIMEAKRNMFSNMLVEIAGSMRFKQQYLMLN